MGQVRHIEDARLLHGALMNKTIVGVEADYSPEGEPVRLRLRVASPYRTSGATYLEAGSVEVAFEPWGTDVQGIFITESE